LRAGPLSNPQIIQLLNEYFVPVYTSNDFIAGGPDSAKQEKAERDRVYRAFLDARMSAGSVHVYVLSPDAKPIGSIHVAHAGDKDKTTGKDRTQLLLEGTIRDLKPARGKPLVRPHGQSERPSAPADALVLHLTARKLTEKGSWNEFPAEDWIVLSKAQWQNLLPREPLHEGQAWDVGREASTPILTRFFPQTECCTAHDAELLSATGNYRHRLEDQALRGTVVSVEPGKATIRLDGRSRVLHQFYPNHPYPPTVSTAKVIGYVILDRATGKITSLRLVSEGGRFEKMDMGVAVESQG
jgi:hypothetical protein